MNTENQVKQELYTALKELGLSDLEIELYTISLALGPSPIKLLAEHMKVSRPNVYKVIDGLEQRGLASFSDRKKYMRDFQVEPPTKVLELVRKKKEKQDNIEYELASAMPDLLALFAQGDYPTRIKVFNTPEQFVQLFRKILEEGKEEMEYFGSASDFIGFISWQEEKRWIKKRLKQGLGIRALLLPSDDANTLKSNDASELRETRILKNAGPFVTSFQLFANKVVIWQPKATLAVQIEDQYIVAMFRSMFNLMWEKSK